MTKKARQLLTALIESNDSQSVAVGECLQTIAENGDGQDTNEHLIECANAIISAAVTFISQLKQTNSATYWVHKGHETGGELNGPYATPDAAGGAIAAMAITAFKLEGNQAVGERTFAIVDAKSKAAAEKTVNAMF